MTNEKAIMCLEDMKIKVPIPKAAKQARENNEALDVAIKALAESELGTNLASLGTDCIDRQAAIDAIRDMQAFEDDNGQPYLYLYDVMAVFTDEEELPPIQPAEPKRGKWILDRSGAYCCSECMEPCATYVMMKPRDKFCKMCGAKMEVNHESN